MKIGKLSNEDLQKIIFDKIKITNKEVLQGAGIGLDAGILDFGGDLFIISTDPITGSKNGIGRLSVNISCNDIATMGAKPIGIMITMLIPPQATKNDIEEITDEIILSCKEAGVDLIGGHTEVTEAVNRFVLSCVCIGRKNKLLPQKTKSKDYLLMTKTAGLEGSAILCLDKEDELSKVLSSNELSLGKSLIKETSVVKEGLIAGSYGASLMHDATEGGVLGAAWEMANCAGLGLEIYEDKIPFLPLSKKICEHYNIDLLRLISSGVMLIACHNPEKIREELKKEGIKAEIIGKFTENKEVFLINGEEKTLVTPPDSDELYKVI